MYLLLTPFIHFFFFDQSSIIQGWESEVQQDLEVEGTVSLSAAVPQSSPPKPHPTEGHLATLLLTSPEQTGSRSKPSRSGKYLALAPSWTMRSVGQLIYSHVILCLSCDDLARFEIHFFAGHWIYVHHDDYMQGTNKAIFSFEYMKTM